MVAAHIHEAPPGEPGPIVVPLFEGTFAGTDEVSDCVDVDKSLIKDIRKHPDDYYVNTHARLRGRGRARPTREETAEVGAGAPPAAARHGGQPSPTRAAARVGPAGFLEQAHDPL